MNEAANDPDQSDVTIDVTEVNPAWGGYLPDAAAVARRAARHALATAAPELACAELSLVLSDDDMVRQLNREWRGQDKPTNVLSFPAQELRPGGPLPQPPLGAPLLLGDVVLAAETVAAEASAQGKRVADHLSHLVVHGVLHLLGFDHEADADAALMERREVAILAGLGIADPYRETVTAEARHG